MNMWGQKQMYIVLLRRPYRWFVQQPARHSGPVLHLQPSPHRDGSWQAALCFCLALHVCHSGLRLLGRPGWPSGCLSGQTGQRCHVRTCLFVLERIERIKDNRGKDRRERESWEDFIWREKKSWGGAEPSEGWRGEATLLTNYFAHRGTFIWLHWSAFLTFKESLVIQLNDSVFQSRAAVLPRGQGEEEWDKARRQASSIKFCYEVCISSEEKQKILQKFLQHLSANIIKVYYFAYL